MKINRPRRHLHPIILPSIFLLLVSVLAIYLRALNSVDLAGFALANRVPRALQWVIMLFTEFGSTVAVIAVALGWAVFELSRRQYERAALMAASLLSIPIYVIIKNIVERARPVTEYVTSHGLHDFSFPSGHTTGATVVYGILAYLISQRFPRPKNKWVIAAAVLLIFLIGFSRVYLGAHYTTDVVGGWLIGMSIISLLTSISAWWHKKHTQNVNPPGAA